MTKKRQKLGVCYGYPYRYARLCDVLAVESRKWCWVTFLPDNSDLFGIFNTKSQMEKATKEVAI